ncbi:MAG: MBL fold metallo-hydrolase RNA specificity domain-containing protein [Candidatus Korarchaeum sp.]
MLRFLGGARCVGRSGVEVTGRSSLILDYGIDLGAASSKLTPLDPRTSPEALILTHAHLDHYGASPLILKQWDCDVYVTPPTVDVGEILLKDFLSLSSEYTDKPYSFQDVQLLRRRERSIRLNDILYLDGWELRTFNAGHVLGSVMIHLTSSDGKSLLYTGDLNTSGTRTLRGAETELPKVDYLIMEATYGGDADVHPSRKKVERQFVEDIKSVIARGGVTIIPTFALGRAQEVLLTLIHYIESGVLQEVPIFVDGMIREISKYYNAYWSWLRPEIQRVIRESRRGLFDHRAIEEVRNREELLELSEPFIVLTTSGMLQGGPVITYLRHFGTRSGNLIYLTGYQVKGTRGRMLLDGIRQIPMPDGTLIEVKSEVKFADFSAHADQPNLINFVTKIASKGLKEVFLVHGESEKLVQLRRKLEGRNIRTYIPHEGEVIVLR